MDKEPSEGKKQELQQKYMELQMLSQQMQQVQKQLQMISDQTIDLNTTKDALDEISKVEPGTETIFPLASGIFLKGKVMDNKEVIMNVGAQTAVPKSIPDSQKIIDEQISEISEFKQQLDGNLVKLSLKAQELEKELAELSK